TSLLRGTGKKPETEAAHRRSGGRGTLTTKTPPPRRIAPGWRQKPGSAAAAAAAVVRTAAVTPVAVELEVLVGVVHGVLEALAGVFGPVHGGVGNVGRGDADHGR